MLAIVRLALAKPYSFVVLAILILLLGPLAAARTPTDIFPDIRDAGDRRGVAVQRPGAEGHVRAAIIYYYERQPDLDGQRHRPYRKQFPTTASAL